MTTISTDDVRQLAVLSGLMLADDEVEALRADISNILTYVDQLGELDTESVEPTFQVTGLTNVMRDDIVQTSHVTTDELLSLAPESTNNQIKVPKVL